MRSASLSRAACPLPSGPNASTHTIPWCWQNAGRPCATALSDQQIDIAPFFHLLRRMVVVENNPVTLH